MTVTTIKIIQRYGLPNEYDMAPKGSICIADMNDTKTKYIQMSDDENKPLWVLKEEYEQNS